MTSSPSVNRRTRAAGVIPNAGYAVVSSPSPTPTMKTHRRILRRLMVTSELPQTLQTRASAGWGHRPEWAEAEGQGPGEGALGPRQGEGAGERPWRPISPIGPRPSRCCER